MTAPAARAYTVGHDTANTTTTTVTAPTYVAGDSIYIGIISDGASNSFTTPTGFSDRYKNVGVFSNTSTLSVFYKDNATAGDTSYSCVVANSERQTWICWSVPPNAGLDASGTTVTGNSITATIPAVTTLTDDAGIFGLVGVDGSGLIVSGWSAYTLIVNNSPGASGGGLALFYTSLASHGTQAAESTITLDASEQWAGLSFALKPLVTSINGAAAITLGALTLSATGLTSRLGAADITLGALTMSATGTVAVQGQAAITLGALTLAAVGTTQTITLGQADITLGALTMTATGVNNDRGQADITLGELTLAAEGLLGRIGAADITLDPLTVTAAGTLGTHGVANITLGALTLSAGGLVADVVVLPRFSGRSDIIPPMGTIFLVNIEDAGGNKLGGGPLFTGIKWTYKQKISQAGEWSLEVPLADPRLRAASLKRRVHCYVRRGTRNVWLGGGIIQSRGYGLSGDNVPVMTLSGPDLLRELVGVTVKFEVNAVSTEDSYGHSGGSSGDALTPRTTLILNKIFAAIPNWTAALPEAVTTAPLCFVFTGESNAGGLGLNSSATANEIVQRPAVQIMNLTSGAFGFEDLDIGTNNLRDHAGLESYYDNSHGWENGLANAVEAGAFPGHSQVYLVKTGQGGSKVADWNVGGTYWTKFLQRISAAKAQLANPRWVVWYSLGLNDGFAGTNIATFKADTIAHLTKIKAELPGAIIIMTQFQSLTGGSGYPAINAALAEIATTEANVYVMDSYGATLRDSYHWNYAGLKLLAANLITNTKIYMRAASTTGLPEITARFVHESVLSALISVCEKVGAFFWMEPYTTAPRKIVIATTPVVSNIIATNLVEPLAAERNPNVCILSDIERTETSWDAHNRLIVYGAGDGTARLTLAAATLWPDGSSIVNSFAYTDPIGRPHNFVLDKTTNTITDTFAVDEFGQDEISVAYKDVAPITNNDADMIAAANTLVSQAVTSLVLSSYPVVGYRLSVAALRAIVHPGMQIRVVAQKFRNGVRYIDVNEMLIIQEVDYQVDAAGEKVVGLTVATTWQPEKTGATIISESIHKLNSLEAHPQMGPTDPVICYKEDIDDEFGATFPFWVSNNTTVLNSVIVRFKLDKLRSTVKTIGGTATASLSIPAHHHTSTVASHTHSTPITGAGSPTGSHPFAQLLYFDATDSRLYFQAGDGDAEAVGTASGGGQSVTSNDGGGQNNLEIDISNALTAVYGIYQDPFAPYGVADLAWEVNGLLVTSTPTSISADWYEMDITSLIINSATLRPKQAANNVIVAVKNKVGRRVRVTAQIEIRKTIQAIAVDSTGVSAAAARGSSILSSPVSATAINANTLDGLDSTDFVRTTGYGLIKTSIGNATTFTIAEGYQYIVDGVFTVNGVLDCQGELIVI